MNLIVRKMMKKMKKKAMKINWKLKISQNQSLNFGKAGLENTSTTFDGTSKTLDPP